MSQSKQQPSTSKHSDVLSAYWIERQFSSKSSATKIVAGSKTFINSVIIFCSQNPFTRWVRLFSDELECMETQEEFQKDYERVQNGPLPNHITGNSLISEIKDDPELFSVVCGLMVKLADAKEKYPGNTIPSRSQRLLRVGPTIVDRYLQMKKERPDSLWNRRLCLPPNLCKEFPEAISTDELVADKKLWLARSTAESDDEDYVDILTDKPVFSIRDLPVPKQIKYFEEEEKEFDREYQIKKKECERLKKLRDQATQKRKKSVADLKNNAFNNQLADASVKLFGTTEESFKACRTLATSFSELVNHLKRKGLNVESVLFPQHAAKKRNVDHAGEDQNQNVVQDKQVAEIENVEGFNNAQSMDPKTQDGNALDNTIPVNNLGHATNTTIDSVQNTEPDTVEKESEIIEPTAANVRYSSAFGEDKEGSESNSSN